MRRCPRRFRRHAIRKTKRGARAGRLWELWRREKGDGACMKGVRLLFEVCGAGVAREEVSPARNTRDVGRAHRAGALGTESREL